MGNTAPSQQKASMPQWLESLLAKGYSPYVATSRHVLPSLNTSAFGCEMSVHLLDDEEQVPFHEAYLLSNSLSFSSPDLKMPNWVMIDCALMQSAIVGFTRALKDIPEELLRYYREDPRIDLKRLDRIPVTGQIASPSANVNSLVGISLFSLGRQIAGDTQLGLYTKALALEVYGARCNGLFYGIAQYDNPALKVHGRFSTKMEIEQTMVPLHPRKDMTLIYKMAINYDPFNLDERPSALKPSFWLNAKDSETKAEIQRGLNVGRRYQIAPPFVVRRHNELFLPIVEEY